ncbi:UDP-N-acetylmuramoyl-tripeptide--D-alanyl-D-alanine ligase [Pelagibacterium sp. 26DY04]|uniref:UDP-N-acetylmuramoyl-tripeptide--D-alanyl-D- alanine ligase n=1 Tax=Pelagibacterium sp. 26DY04 TaxID=2967130 RepID=UPI0028154216|nr:UDP-N-acetylmuramoyl-tripeptide--D-alanyl-D-alanine ligase [Pelagibacterium sp. 26DY04]WMT85840.1 UDP-N-acetylmuramoyl-tripeptide--D-alanyl-D-alanine ligase [Pelagibacterium sp. 26DY04]
MDALYSISEIVAATGGSAEGVAAGAVSSISIDSREIAPGALFVAIKGENFDGHDFVGKAIEAGAVAALVSREKAEALAGLPLIVVEDALEGLNELARFSRSRSKARIVAVTGSVGKTSTKEAIRVALEASGKTHASIKSFNNHWGVPLMLARMPADMQFGVFEIGMNHAGEITPLSRLVRPHVAVITTVAPAHLEFFPSVGAIADAKAEIFSGVEPGGAAILGRDHEHVERLIDAARAAGLAPLTYGFEAADVTISDYHPTPDGGAARVSGDGLSLEIATATAGRHMLANAVAALLVARALGADVEKSVAALARHGAPEGRGAASLLGDRANPLRLIDESYNANPTSMRAALEVFADMPTAGRRVLVLGDMRELGAAAEDYHAELAPAVVSARPDLVFLVGRHMGALDAALPAGLVAKRTQAVDEIAQDVLQTLAPGDSVMLKGSNGVRLGTLVARIRDRFGAQ